MTMEITSVEINATKKIVYIYGIDCSETNLQRLERRDDGFEKEMEFCFDTRDQKTVEYLRDYLRRQKVVRELVKQEGHPTWGAVLQEIVGTIIQAPSGRYRVWE